MLEHYVEAELRFLEIELMLNESAIVNDKETYQQLVNE